MTTATKPAEGKQAIVTLVEQYHLKPGDTLHTILRHVSPSGMSRRVSVVKATADGVEDITYLVARILGYRRNEHDGGLVVSGCGMDMGFEVVYNLGRDIYPDGVPCIGQGCNSNDHNNGDRDYTTGRVHKDGGYAYRQRWL